VWIATANLKELMVEDPHLKPGKARTARGSYRRSRPSSTPLAERGASSEISARPPSTEGAHLSLAASLLYPDGPVVMNLSIVIPSYNAKALLRQALTALRAALPEDVEVILIDGSSPDGSYAMVRQEFPWVRAQSCPNHGFAHAVNRGIEAATAEHVLVLNSDLFLTREALQAMRMHLASNERVGAVAPVLVNLDGSRQRLFGAFGMVYWPNWRPVRVPAAVPLLSFACLMTRRSVLRDVGAFDESFFLYNEEYDWCVRARRAGYRLEILPQTVVHVGAGSTTPSPALSLEARRGFLYVVKKHAPPLVGRALRRAMQFQGYCYKYIDPRDEHRRMWAIQESLMARSALMESPFPLSGRGDGPARPSWSALGDRAAQGPLTAT